MTSLPESYTSDTILRQLLWNMIATGMFFLIPPTPSPPIHFWVCSGKSGTRNLGGILFLPLLPSPCVNKLSWSWEIRAEECSSHEHHLVSDHLSLLWDPSLIMAMPDQSQIPSTGISDVWMNSNRYMNAELFYLSNITDQEFAFKPRRYQCTPLLWLSLQGLTVFKC